MTNLSRRVSYAVLAAALIAAAPASARTYKWVDANGTTHYSQSMPADASVEVAIIDAAPAAAPTSHDCQELTCRLERLRAQRAAAVRVEDTLRDVATRVPGGYPVWPTPVAETDDEKIARLVAECKRSRGSDCDSDREKRRMLLQHVELTQAERRALRGLSPRLQRRVLLERIPKRYRNID
ncbi:MAG: DUF4124 domain-containing protein [Gammaproteobacteria bacterium]|nr:DUF4124 domain-containing protein [Gammaproteobacteria bacterium]